MSPHRSAWTDSADLAAGTLPSSRAGFVPTPTKAAHYRLLEFASFKNLILPRPDNQVKHFGRNVSRGTSPCRGPARGHSVGAAGWWVVTGPLDRGPKPDYSRRHPNPRRQVEQPGVQGAGAARGTGCGSSPGYRVREQPGVQGAGAARGTGCGSSPGYRVREQPGVQGAGAARGTGCGSSPGYRVREQPGVQGAGAARGTGCGSSPGYRVREQPGVQGAGAARGTGCGSSPGEGEESAPGVTVGRSVTPTHPILSAHCGPRSYHPAEVIHEVPALGQIPAGPQPMLSYQPPTPVSLGWRAARPPLRSCISRMDGACTASRFPRTVPQRAM